MFVACVFVCLLRRLTQPICTGIELLIRLEQLHPPKPRRTQKLLSIGTLRAHDPKRAGWRLACLLRVELHLLLERDRQNLPDTRAERTHRRPGA